MSIEDIVKDLSQTDASKMISPNGITYMEEMQRAAKRLIGYINGSIASGTFSGNVSAGDISSVKIVGNTLSVTINIGGEIRPSIFQKWNNKEADIFWLFNDGFTVKNTEPFNRFGASKEKFLHRTAEKFVENGIKKFESSNNLGIRVKLDKPSLYYW